MSIVTSSYQVYFKLHKLISELEDKNVGIVEKAQETRSDMPQNIADTEMG